MIEKLINLSDDKIERLFTITFSMIFGWLLVCAWLIEGEYGDGYSTIINSRYFFANAENYLTQRGPLAGLALFPVEMFVKYFNSHPLDVRPYHVYTALLHSVYLIGCWIVVKKLYGSSLPSFLGFVSAIFTVIFVAFSPYISHDIIPGLFMVLLIYFVNKWLIHHKLKWVIYAIILGASVVLIKQTYAIFWFAIIIAIFIGILVNRDSCIFNKRNLTLLLCMASVSAVLSWIGYGWVSLETYPDTSLFLRPVKIINAVAEHYSGDKNFDGGWSQIFPWTLYWNNLNNYGIAAMSLIVPGLYLSLKSKNNFNFLVSVCWIVCVVFILTIGAREARYLAFMAPLTMILIVPVIQKLLVTKNKIVISLLLLLMTIDFSRSITLASAYISNAGSLQIRRFLSPIDELLVSKNRLILSHGLSFAFLQKSPLYQDRYHGIYHLVRGQISELYQGKLNVVTFKGFEQLNSITLNEGDIVFLNNDTLLRAPPWTENNRPYGMESFVQLVGKVVKVKLIKNKEYFELDQNYLRTYILLKNSSVLSKNVSDWDNDFQLIDDNKITNSLASKYFGVKTNKNEFEVMLIEIKRFCFANNCSYIDG